MSKEELLEGLRDLERREKPGSATAQLREIEAEVTALLEKGYTLQQVWRSLAERGLKLSFSGFKSSFYRMQKEVNELQKVSNGIEACPHCGAALTVDKAGNQEGETGALQATNSQPLSAGGEPSGVRASNGRMGDVFARRLESGSLNRGLLGGPPTVHPKRVPPVPCDVDKPK
ncbi:MULTISPECIES: hypothetical protein [Burkholderia]|uniref:hypothetical protein n=1 Tax=Burkholderia TaxID=32008 RepID=UPI000F5B2FA7|nr:MULTISPECIES: hypothetical protein [Burkholderia]